MTRITKQSFRFAATLVVALFAHSLPAISAEPPGPSESLELRDGHLLLQEDRLAAEWDVSGGTIKPLNLTDGSRARKYDLTGSSLFTVQMGDTNGVEVIDSSALKLAGPVKVTPLPAQPDAQCLSDRIPGWTASATLIQPSNDATFKWELTARSGQNYFREQVAVLAGAADLPVRRVQLIDWPVDTPRVIGVTPGSPIVSGNLFCAVEHPNATSEVSDGHARCALDRTVPVMPKQPFIVSAVVGVARDGQLRRDFQTYLNQERPRPYGTFLHFNSWYDLGNFNPFGEQDALKAIETIGSELSTKRGVTLSSFLFDDGWDNHQSLWDFNSGFPHGFTPLIPAVERFHAGLGVWLSPWGGYSQPKLDRLHYGEAAGYEISNGGFALSGPKYFQRFLNVCLHMLREEDINQFKFDGTGNVTSRYPGSKFGTDFDAMIALIQSLRAAKPNLFINLTTGTWPSPFWTRYADSIWRGGPDHSFAGVGSLRQEWITFRDGQEYHGIVQRGPLFPLNSLMLHGIIFARYAEGLTDDPGDDFADEVHDYFGTGTQCQEMYVTGSLLSASNWNTLAEAANWSRANVGTLRDVHWIGGDPLRGEVYGFAAWSPGKGILTLRNPSAKPGSIELDPAEALELPSDAAGRFAAHSPWAADREMPAVTLRRGQKHRFTLMPWQVLTLELTPAG